MIERVTLVGNAGWFAQLPAARAAADAVSTSAQHRVRTPQPATSTFPTYSGGYAAADASRTFRYPVTFDFDCADVSFKFGHWCVPAGRPSGVITIKAALEVHGQVRPMTFIGAPSILLAPHATVMTDVLPVSLPAGTPAWVRVWAAGAHPRGKLCVDAAVGDVAHGGETGASYEAGYHPIAIFAIPRVPGASIVGVGDSVSEAASDEFVGWVGRAGTLLRVSTQRSAKGGIGTRDWLDQSLEGGWHYRDTLAGATHATVHIGSNELAFNGTSAADVIDGLTLIYRELLVRGIVPIGATMLPRTGADGSTPPPEAEGAYGPGEHSSRATINTWIRQGGAGLQATYVAADLAVETGLNTNVWQAGMTEDGLHPTPAGHQAMALAARTAIAPLIAKAGYPPTR